MHVMAAMQLMGEAGDMQIPNASLAGVFNMGGTAVANYVSIMERVKCTMHSALQHPAGGVAPSTTRVMNLSHFLARPHAATRTI